MLLCGDLDVLLSRLTLQSVGPAPLSYWDSCANLGMCSVTHDHLVCLLPLPRFLPMNHRLLILFTPLFLVEGAT